MPKEETQKTFVQYIKDFDLFFSTLFGVPFVDLSKLERDIETPKTPEVYREPPKIPDAPRKSSRSLPPRKRQKRVLL